jgi:uncharacterized protein
VQNNSYLKKYSNSITFKIEAREADYLYFKESQIEGSGNGLFTCIPIYKDEIISIFRGVILSNKEARSRVTNKLDSYFINLPDGTILDSMNTKCFAKYANDSLGFIKSKFKINSKITLDENGSVCIVANKKITTGEEIFCSYGNEYWKKYRKTL